MIRTILKSLALLTVVILTACSTTQNDPSLEVDNIVTKGVIDNFGSIFVNGTEFKTDGATLHLRDLNSDPVLVSETQVRDFLKKGMVVTVKGLVSKNGLTGTAQEVEFRNTMEAKIDANGVDLVNNTISVFGQKIIVDDSIKSLLATMNAGDVVEISGLPDDKGQIKATFLEKKASVTEFEAKGYVKLIPGSNSSFTLLLAPGAATGITVNVAVGTPLPAEGSFIEVKTAITASGSTISATSLKAEVEIKPGDNQKVSIDGIPSSGTVDDFVLNGQRVQTNAQTEYVNGIKANFSLSRKIQAHGTVVGGILIADRITFKVVNGGVSKGVIEKFGNGVSVNGVEFKTIGATLHLRDDKTTPDRVLQSEAEISTLLKPGMVVTIKGGFDNTGTSGIAQEIEYRNSLEGKIDDKGVDFITVMGQKIIADDSVKAVFDTLVIGDKVGVSGLPDDRGQIRATHIAKNDNLAEFEAKGVISGLSGNTFSLKLDKNAASGLAVTLGSGVVLPAGAVEGSFVEVRTLSIGGIVTATKVELEDELKAAENEKIEFEGFVASGTADDFIVNGQRIQTTAATLFDGGIKADFGVNMKVEAEGASVGGILVATKVSFKDNVRIDAIVGAGAINAATSSAGDVTLLGKKVIVSGTTLLKGLANATLDLKTVAAGQEIQIRGFMASNGTDIIATRIDLKDTAPDSAKFRPFLRGPVSAISAGTLTIAGIVVDTTGASFRKINDPPATTISGATFFGALTLNSTVVKVTWSAPFSATSAAVREAELEI